MIFYSPFFVFFIAIIWLGFFNECSNGSGIIGEVPKNIGESSSSRGRNTKNKESGDSDEVPLKFKHNHWDKEFCRRGIAIEELEGGKQKLTISFFKTIIDILGGYRVFAKDPISLNNDSIGIFYFEITVKKMESDFFFGFAEKRIENFDKMQNNKAKHIYAYFDNGNFFNYDSKEDDGQHSIKSGDIVGIGVNLDSRKIFFTKNGNKLAAKYYSLSSSSSISQLFPFVTLAKVGAEIETNFGPNFNYKVPIRKFSIQTPESFLRGGEITKQENRWDLKDIDIEITGLTVQNKKRIGCGWRSVFAKHSISPNNDSSNIFYFEITVKKLKSSFLFGFADEQQRNLLRKGINFRNDTYV